MSAPASPGLLAHLVGFCRALRERRVLATPAEAIEAARAVEALGLDDRAALRDGLRALLTTRVEDFPIFDAVFEEWWPLLAEPGGVAAPAGASAPGAPRPPRMAAPRQARPGALSLAAWSGDAGSDETLSALASPSAIDASGGKDFATFAPDEMAAVTRGARRMARRLAARPSRRWKAARRGARVSLRRTLRASLRTGGEAVELARLERRLRKTKLVLLCDVSGSMDLYSRFLLQFLYALQHGFARVETFVFSTRLSRVTPHLVRGTYREALDALARRDTGWSGGTKIGDSLAAFVAGWPRLVDRRTVVIVLSDGWDTGEPETLSAAMRALHARAGRLIWLNPLLGSPSYRPLTRGMRAALPHFDVFAAGHNLAALESLVGHLNI